MRNFAVHVSIKESRAFAFSKLDLSTNKIVQLLNSDKAKITKTFSQFTNFFDDVCSEIEHRLPFFLFVAEKFFLKF